MFEWKASTGKEGTKFIINWFPAKLVDENHGEHGWKRKQVGTDVQQHSKRVCNARGIKFNLDFHNWLGEVMDANGSAIISLAYHTGFPGHCPTTSPLLHGVGGGGRHGFAL